MKVFISWSGEKSRMVAISLREWLADVLPNIRSFVSSEDLRKGSRWRTVLANELAESRYGILCLTPTNLDAPWVMFEAGAISAAFEESQVCTLLLGNLKPSDVKDPLASFNHTVFNKSDMIKLAIDINSGAGDNARDAASLNRSFEKFWPDLEDRVQASLAIEEDKTIVHIRSQQSILEEILDHVRTYAKQFPSKDPKLIRTRIRVDSPETVCQLFANTHQGLTEEFMIVILLDTKFQLIRVEETSHNGLNKDNIQPREVFRAAMEHSAYAVVLVHNHLSGDPTPSKADKLLTKKLVEAGQMLNIVVADHIIIGGMDADKQSYYSFKEAGVIS